MPVPPSGLKKKRKSSSLKLAAYSFGMGDRFAHQAQAQLRACMLAREDGIPVVPVWNKSNREHKYVGSQPADVRDAAMAAVRTLGWTHPFHIDADHVNLESVGRFVESSDYFTIDVASAIGCPAPAAEVDRFVAQHEELRVPLKLPGMAGTLQILEASVAQSAGKYLSAVQEAALIYRRIEEAKGKGSFITEVSMDETDAPQTPAELLVILAALADRGVPVQTIAPKFTGRFNKGVDYAGDIARFEDEFRSDIAVIAHVVRTFDLPGNLKLSVHSGSDKFSLYPVIRRALQDFGAGVHVKTAGTTWLEELTGLAEAGGESLDLAKEIYAEAFTHRDELCAPYASVVDIDAAALPTPGVVRSWPAARFASALRHDPRCPEFDANMRQLLHVAYKIAADRGSQFLEMLEACEQIIARNVTGNLYERHLKQTFPAR